jgi:colanic acid/amylovoran biosynthesis protein
MRILVEQSGYELVNLGDRAMLEAGIRQISRLWADAFVSIVTEADSSVHFPEANPVYPFIGPKNHERSGKLGRGAKFWAKQYLPAMAGRVQFASKDGLLRRGLLMEIEEADVVLSTGGGFINDVFTFHARGILAVLDAAQRLGKPTAMFGQGIGPIHKMSLIRQARSVLPKLDVLGLRTPELGPIVGEFAQSGWTVTGDEALFVADAGLPPAVGDSLGLNVRHRAYAGVGETELARLQVAVARLKSLVDGPIVPLPIDVSDEGSDLGAIQRLTGESDRSHEIASTKELVEAVKKCRIVVTGSYHAAVFALARGIPVVGLSRSAYYVGKFKGLGSLYPPGAVTMVALESGTMVDDLVGASELALAASLEHREAIASVSLDLVDRAARLWERFADIVSSAPKA